TVPRRWEHSWWWSIRRTVFVLSCYVPLALVLAYDLFRRGAHLKGWRRWPLAWFTASALLSALVTMTAAGSSNNHYVPFIAWRRAVAAIGAHRLMPVASRADLLVLPIAAVLFAATFVTTVAYASFRGHAIPTHVPVVIAGAAVLPALIRIRNA